MRLCLLVFPFFASLLSQFGRSSELGVYRAVSAHGTRRLDHSDHQSLKWNAGMVKTRAYGWVTVATHNTCFWQSDGCVGANAPWVAFMGKGQVPEPHHFEEAGSVWTVDGASFDAKLPGVAKGGDYNTEDYRVLLWNGSLYLNAAVHAFNFAVRPDQEYNYYPALLRMDMKSKTVKLEYIFKERLDGSKELPEIEKNWGFFEKDGRLMILYSTFPCTVVYEFDDRSRTLARPVSKHCYHELDSQAYEYTYLSLEQTYNSANPVVWERNGKRELLMVVHNKNTDKLDGYNHWLVRIDYDTFVVTHISHGVVVGCELSNAGGFLRDVIVVASISIVEEHGTQFYYILGGEGDTHSAYWVAALNSIQWLPLISLANGAGEPNN